MSCCRVIVDESHEVPFRGLQDSYYGGIDKEFWLEEGLILVVVISLV